MMSRYRTSMPRRLAGFNMIELLVVLAILGVLAGAVMPLGEAMLVSQKERDLRAGLVEIRTALDAYKQATDKGRISKVTASGYPPTLSALVSGAPDIRPEYRGQVHYFLRRIPRDPFADPSLADSAAWQLRSYASPPERPAPGDDVYDVYSTSDGIALDGSRYSAW